MEIGCGAGLVAAQLVRAEIAIVGREPPEQDLERRYGGWDRRTFAGKDDEIVMMARWPV